MSVLSDPAAESEQNGWPAVQARVLHELAFSARKMGNTRLAVKLLSGLLHNTHQYLNKSEQVEMLMALENYSKALIVKGNDTDESLREAATLPLFSEINFQGKKKGHGADTVRRHFNPCAVRPENPPRGQYSEFSVSLFYAVNWGSEFTT